MDPRGGMKTFHEDPFKTVKARISGDEREVMGVCCWMRGTG